MEVLKWLKIEKTMALAPDAAMPGRHVQPNRPGKIPARDLAPRPIKNCLA
jgi:hypothetical protein